MIIFAIGGTSSLGKVILSNLSKRFKIYSSYNSKKPPKELLKKKIKFFKLDLNLDNKKKEKIISSFIKKYSLLTKKIILLNFSVYKKNQLFINASDENINKSININIKSNIELIKFFLPIMIKNNYGRIIHLSSTKVIDGEVGTLLYSASKTFLNGFSSSIATEYGKFNITSNILSLGYFKSNLWNKIPERIKNQRIMDVPGKKLGSVNNISNAIEFIINSEYVNKSIIKIDGGI